MVGSLAVINYVDIAASCLLRNYLDSQLCASVVVKISHFLQLVTFRHVGQLAGIYVAFSIYKTCCPDFSVGPHVVFFLTFIDHIDHSALYHIRNYLDSQLRASVIVEVSHFLQLVALRHVGQLAGVYVAFSVCKACCPDFSVGPHGIIFLAEVHDIDKTADSWTVLAVIISAVSSVVMVSSTPVVIVVIIVIIVVPAIIVPTVFPSILPVVSVVRSRLRLQDTHLASRHYKRCCKQ